jgi:transcriptional regulator with XRE-family HTH domain
MKKQIGAVLKKYRSYEKGMTQIEVAEIITGKRNYGYISGIELGKRGLSFDYLEKLLKIYGKSDIDFLIDLIKEYHLPSNSSNK